MEKFLVIPNEQTPELDKFPEMSVKEYIDQNKTDLLEFLDFANQQDTAVGLAGNQVSMNDDRFLHRVFALRNLEDDTWGLIINPQIIEYIGIEEFKSELCLTWKGRKIIAPRHRAVKVKYYDFAGNEFTETYKGFEAQIWQHEINHLNGVSEKVVELSHPDPKDLNPPRNEPCPCGSGKKYKKCCFFIKVI